MSRSIQLELDYVAKAAYIALSDEPVVRTVQLTNDVLVDLDKYDVVVGIEVLSLDAPLPLDRLQQECHVHSSVIDLLNLIRPTVNHFVVSATSAPSASVNDRDRTLSRS